MQTNVREKCDKQLRRIYRTWRGIQRIDGHQRRFYEHLDHIREHRSAAFVLSWRVRREEGQWCRELCSRSRNPTPASHRVRPHSLLMMISSINLPEITDLNSNFQRENYILRNSMSLNKVERLNKIIQSFTYRHFYF